MLPVLPIRVLKPKTPEQRLDEAQAYLSTYGSAAIVDTVEQKTLTYQRLASINPLVTPILDEGKISIAYVPRTHQWKCESTLFNMGIRREDPKLFASDILSMVEHRLGSKQQFLSRVQWYWQRYNGAQLQFLHKLGANLVNQGVMTTVDTAETGGVFGHWHNTLDSKFDVWFSVKADVIRPKYSFGFHPEAAAHAYDLSVTGCQVAIDTLEKQKAATAEFLQPLIRIF